MNFDIDLFYTFHKILTQNDQRPMYRTKTLKLVEENMEEKSM